MTKISNLPPKGTSDWFPDEFKKRKYIFDTWRKVCLSYGYQEYLTPIIESAEVYRAKSGEDVGGKELMTMIDRAGRELAIRPEMTPSVTRLVSRIYESAAKPLRLFSIANFLRNEKPQRGRNREFWQLNCDIFGSTSIISDLEIIALSIDILKEFGANKDQFVVYINDRRLINDFLTKYLRISSPNISVATRILDKFGKIENIELINRLKVEANAEISDDKLLINYLNFDSEAIEYLSTNFLQESEGLIAINNLISKLFEMGLGEYVKFNPAMIRGFDYYDGMIFEVYNKKDFLKKTGVIKTDESFRSLFGGGRYNGLASIFGASSFASVGFAPGDETTKLFLEEYNLFNFKDDEFTTYYIPLLNDSFLTRILDLASVLRQNEKNIVKVGVDVQKISKAVETADKMNANFVVLFGENELSKGIYTLKDLKSGQQMEIKI